MEAIATSQDWGVLDSVSSKIKRKNKLKGKGKEYRKGKGQVFLVQNAWTRRFREHT